MKRYAGWIMLIILFLIPHHGNSISGAEKPQVVSWKTLYGLNYKTGKMTKEVTDLNGKVIRVPGFMVPLEIHDQKVHEFLFVPTRGACSHVPPPPPNLIIYVKMPKSQPAQFDWSPD